MKQVFGISAALTTAFATNGNLHIQETVEHACDLLNRGCASITLFGTTGEGASLTQMERSQLVKAMLGSGINEDQLIACVMESSSKAAKNAIGALIDTGIKTILLAPPFYYKTVTDDALFNWFLRALEPAYASSIRVILYHIPQVTGIALSTIVVNKLSTAYPSIVYAVKDSGGSQARTKEFIEHTNTAVLVGDERYLASACGQGASGSISGIANVAHEELTKMVSTCEDNPLLHKLVDEVVSLPTTAAVKSLVARSTGNDIWLNMRPPLSPISDKDASRLFDKYDELASTRSAGNNGSFHEQGHKLL